MPLPDKNKEEDKDKFISRCMSNPKMQSEYPDQKQRVAVCMSRACEGVHRIAASDRQLYYHMFGFEEYITKLVAPQEYLYDDIGYAAETYQYEDIRTGQIYYYTRKGTYKKDGRYLRFVGKADNVFLERPYRGDTDLKPYNVLVAGDDSQLMKVYCSANKSDSEYSKTDAAYWANLIKLRIA